MPSMLERTTVSQGGNEAQSKRWRLATVKVLGFKEDLDSGSSDALGYRVQSDAVLDEENRLVLVVVHIDAVNGETEGDGTIGEIKVLCGFELADLNEWRAESEPVKVPRALMASWLGITISTARGALVGKAQSPVFGLVPFPAVSPMKELEQLMDLSDKEWLASV